MFLDQTKFHVIFILLTHFVKKLKTKDEHWRNKCKYLNQTKLISYHLDSIDAFR